MRLRLAAVSLLLLSFCAATRPATAPVRVPVEIVNTRVHIPVSVNGGPPAAFILDTGAGNSPLAKEYADAAGIRGTGRGQAVGAGGSVPVTIANDITFRFGTIDHRQSRVALVPFGPVSLRAGQPINGVLGHDVLARYITEIDYAGRQVSFHPPGTWQPPADAIAVPIEMHQGLPHIRTRVTLEDGRAFDAKLMVDTGAGAAVVLKKHYTESKKIDTSGLIETAAGMGVGGATRGRIGRLARIELGGITLEKPVVNYSLTTTGHFGGATSDGLIGGEILKRFRFIVDYPHKRLLFVPTPAVHDAFEYDMSGALLTVRDASFSAIDVFSVLPDSPAAEAGLQAGDELIAVGGQPVTVSQLQTIREGFKEAGARHTLTVRRDGAERTVTLTTRRLV